MNTLVRLAVVTSFVTTAMVGLAARAGAVVVPSMGITVRSGGTYFTVCGKGTSAALAGHVWLLTVEGMRTNGVIADFRSGTSATFDQCMTVPKIGAAAGAFTATFTYSGAGTDVAGGFPGYGAWATGQDDVTGDGGITT